MASLPSLDPAVLERAGVMLHGPHWQAPMAEALGLSSPARIRAWMRGYRPIPAGIRAEIVDMLRARGEACRALVAELEASC